MTAEEVKRKTAKIYADMEEVKMDNDGPVAAVATAVQELNQTTAVHAAWTEERFDKVDEGFDTVDKRFDEVDRRLNVLEKGQCDIRQAMSRMETGIREDMRMRENALVWHVTKVESGIRQDMSKMESGIRQDMAKMEKGIRQDMAKSETAIRGDIAQLTARVEQVLSFAIRDEMNVREVTGEATGEARQ